MLYEEKYVDEVFSGFSQCRTFLMSYSYEGTRSV